MLRAALQPCLADAKQKSSWDLPMPDEGKRPQRPDESKHLLMPDGGKHPLMPDEGKHPLMRPPRAEPARRVGVGARVEALGRHGERRAHARLDELLE